MRFQVLFGDLILSLLGECLLFLGLIRALAQNFDQKPKHACSVEFGVLVDIASKLKLRLRYCSSKESIIAQI